MRKRIISILLAFSMVLSLAVIPASAVETDDAASTNLVYYDLQEQTLSSKNGYCSNTSGWNTGKSGSYDLTAGGFIARDSWTRAYVQSGKILKMVATEVAGNYKLNYFGLKVSALNKGDYTVPFRKVTLGFKTSVEADVLCDTPVKLWYNLYAVSAEGLKAINSADADNVLTESMGTKVSELENDDLVLFFWGEKSTIRSSVTVSGSQLYPVCKIGTAGQSDYVNIEYIYEAKSDGTLNVVGLSIDGNFRSTLIDESTPITGLNFKETGNSEFLAYNMRPDFTNTNTKDTAAVIFSPSVKIDNTAKKTTLTYNALKYEGVKSLVKSIEFSGNKNAMAVCGDDLVKIGFVGTPDVNNISSWQDYVVIEDEDKTPFTGAEYVYDKETRELSISVTPENHLKHSGKYTLTIKNTLPYPGEAFTDQEAIVESFETTFAKLDCVSESSDKVEDDFEVNVGVTNTSLTGEEFTATAVLYQKDGGRVSMIESISADAEVGIGLSDDNLYIGTFSVPDDDKEYLIKVFFTENGEAVCDPVVIGEEVIADISDVRSSEERITLEIETVPDSGSVSIDGIYTGTLKRPLYTTVENKENKVVYVDQLTPDKDGKFGADFNLLPGSLSGKYTVKIKAIGETLYTEEFEIDFSSVKPVVTELGLIGTPYCGEEVEADYSYFQFANEPNGSVVTWFADTGENGEFVEIGTGKTLFLEEDLLGHMVKFTVLAKTQGGTEADSPEEFGPFKATAGPVAENVEIKQESNQLSFAYKFSHALGYKEQGSSYTWYRANSQYSEYEKVSESETYTIEETDNNKYFKVEVIPKVSPDGILEIEATGKAVMSDAFKAQYDYSSIPVKPEVSEFLYYDLENQAISGAQKSGYGYGSISSSWGEDPAKAQGGFLRKNSWSKVQVTEATGTTSLYKVITMASDPYAPTAWGKPAQFGMLISSLNPDGNYDVPYRKVSLSFKTSSNVAAVYDSPVALWFNLYAVSKKGLLELADTNHILSEESRNELESMEDNSLILFWWKLKNLSLIDSKDAANSAEIYPICSLGTVGQSSYSKVEYVYSLGNDGTNDTVNASQIKVNGEIKNTIIDGVTPFNSLRFVDTNTTTSYKASSLNASYTNAKYVSVIGVPNNYKNTKKTDSNIETMTLTFRELRYEGMGSFVSGIDISGGDDTALVSGDDLVKIYFAENPDTDSISDWKEYIELKDGNGNSVDDWTGKYNEDTKVYTMSLSSGNSLSHNSVYTITVKKNLPYSEVSSSNAEDEVKSFVTDYRKIKASTDLSEVSDGEVDITVNVENISLFSGNFNAKAVLYKKDGERLTMEDNVSKNCSVSLGDETEISVGLFDVLDDGAEYFVKVFFTENGEIIADSVTIGTPSESEIIDVSSDNSLITAEVIAVSDEGRIELDAKYSDFVVRPVYLTVKKPSGSVIFEDQLSVDAKGRFGIDLNVPEDSESGEYTLELKPVGNSVHTEKVTIDFTKVKPVVKRPELLGLPYYGKEVQAGYDYYHADSKQDASVIEWFANTGNGGAFIKIGTGKTLFLNNELAGSMVKFTVLPKAADGETGDKVVSSAAYKVTGGPAASNILVTQSSNTLTFTYKYSHMLGYEEMGSSYVWYRADSSSGKFVKVYEGAIYSIQPKDSGKYFKVEITPKSNPEQIGDDGEKVLLVEACGESVMSSAIRAEYVVASGASGSLGGGGGGSVSKPSSKDEQKVQTAPVDLSGTVDLTDIKGHWAENDIYNLYDKGIVKGRTQHTYDPEGKITRAEFTALIVRALNLGESEDKSFVDVAESDWYSGVIGAAFQKGILTGSEGNVFPNRNITRQEMAAIIVRAYELSGNKIELDGDILGFEDAASIDTWAIESVAKAKTAGLVKGDGANYRPLDNTSRAEAAVIVSRLLATR